MRQSVPMIAVCLLLSGLAVVGCGSGKEGSTAGSVGEAAAAPGAGGKEGGSRSSGESPGGATAPTVEPTPESKAEFVAKANILCTKRRRQVQATLGKVFQSAQGEGQQAALRRIVDEAIAPGMEAEADDLRALGAPRGDEGRIEAIVTALEATVAEGREDPKAFVTDPGAFKEAQLLAQRYGIGACGKAG